MRKKQNNYGWHGSAWPTQVAEVMKTKIRGSSSTMYTLRVTQHYIIITRKIIEKTKAQGYIFKTLRERGGKRAAIYNFYTYSLVCTIP